MLVRVVTVMAIVLMTWSCKARHGASKSLADAGPSVPYAMVIVGLDGPWDHGEVNRAVVNDLGKCLGNPRLACHMVIPEGDKDYKMVRTRCLQRSRQAAMCQLYEYQNDGQIAETLKSLASKVRVGLLIGHNTGQGLWNHESLTAEALNNAVAYPLVIRACFSEQFVGPFAMPTENSPPPQSGGGPASDIPSNQPGGHLVPVGNGLLAENDKTYFEKIVQLLGAFPQ